MSSIMDIDVDKEDQDKYAKVETVCAGCCFKEVEEDNEVWAHQTGCQFKVLERMRDQGAEIKEHSDYDHCFVYNSIVDRVCVFCRPIKGWMDRFPDATDAGLMELARQEVKPRMGMIIISDGDIMKLQATISSVSKMKIKPHKVCIQFKNNKIRPGSALNLIGGYFDPQKIEYRIDYILENDAIDIRIVDIAFKKIPQSYFCVFEAGFEIPADFIDAIDIALNDDLERFLMLLPIDKINGMVAQTRVTKQIGGSNDDWIIDGTKMWITNGGIADVAVVWAQTEDGIRGFIVPTDTPGFSTNTIHHKLSLRASITSELILDGVRLPRDSVLPNVVGLKGPLACLNEARFGILFGAVGAGRASYEAAVAYSKERIQFGRPIASFQLTQRKLTEMMVKVNQSMLLSMHLGRKHDDGTLTSEQISFGKMENVRSGLEVAREARSILGANGITLEYPVIRHMNNLESVITYEGTNEVHTLVLGQAITGIPAFT